MFNVSKALHKLRGEGLGATLVRGSGGLFLVNVASLGLSFLTAIVLARTLGTEHFGIYTYALVWVQVLILFAQLGFKTSLLRFMPTYIVKEQWSLLRGLLMRSTQYVFVASLLLAGAAALVIWRLRAHFGADQVTTMWISLALLPILSLTSLRAASLRALKLVLKSGVNDSLTRSAIFLLAVLGAAYLGDFSLTAQQVMLLNIFAASVTFVIGTVWLVQAFPDGLRKTTATFAHAEWLRVSLPMFLIAGMNFIANRTDILMIGAYLGPEETGIYEVATRVAGLVTFGLSAVNAMIAPMISELYSADRHQDLQRIVALAAKGIFAFTAIVSAGLIFAGPYLLSIFGKDFGMSYTPMIILVGGTTVSALSGSVGFLMTMTKHQREASVIIGVSALLNIILNALLIPTIGLVGAAASTAVTTVLWNLAMLVFVQRRLNINSTVFARG